jgi:light-regulated signal transduction histidine kinase (bacteriophytochrome)
MDNNKPKDYDLLLKEYEEFAYVVSHDLSAPLRQISGFTDILLGEIGDKLPDTQKVYRDMIMHAVEEAHLSLDALLEFSRLNTDEKTFEEFETKDLLTDVLKKLHLIIVDKHANITSDNLPQKMYGDIKILTQAFYHLIHNALKFQPDDQKPEIKITAEQKDSVITFCIEDNGIGIRPERQEQVFIILRKANSNEKFPGRGVGLTFAKKIAMIHGGDAWLESEPNKGTKIYFSIDMNAKPEHADRDRLKRD